MTDHTDLHDDAPYVPRLGDAVDEAIGRINVVLRMLYDHDCAPDPETQSDPDDDAGYALSVAADALRHVRDLLRASRQAGES